MPAATKDTKRQLSNVLKRFKFEELENAVIPNFPEISWANIRCRLVKHHVNFTVNNAARIIEEVIDNAKIRNNVLQDRLLTLEAIDVSRHDTRRIWYGYEMKNSNRSIAHLTNRNIEKHIQEQFQTAANMDVKVKVVMYNRITYVCIKRIEKKRQNVMPIFFAIFLGQKYFFCARKHVTQNFIKAMTYSLGYSASKQMKLMGKDLRSLIRLVRAKNQGSVDCITDLSPYKDSKPIVKSTGVDFTQRKQRRAYASRCFGENAPKFELLSINGPEIPWVDKAASNLSDETIRVKWEFYSHDVAKYLVNLTERRVLETPLPDYVVNLMTEGQTELTIN